MPEDKLTENLEDFAAVNKSINYCNPLNCNGKLLLELTAFLVN